MNHMRAYAFALLVLINIGLFATVTHLMFFAAKGARYTAEDGARERHERHERTQADLALGARLDLLHNLLAEREAP